MPETSRFAIVDAPINLGLRPSGVELLPDALRRAGLLARLRAREGGRVQASAAYSAERASDTGVLNGPALREVTIDLAEHVSAVVRRGEIPVVLAGDCSVILGGLLGLRLARRALRQPDRVGLLFLDGHVDFYQPEASPTGEVADMDLAIATGRGPRLLTDFAGIHPLVSDRDVVAVGARDAAERDSIGSQDIRATEIRVYELETLLKRGVEAVAAEAVALVSKTELSGFWVHVDADVLDDHVMPAVDYRQPGGLEPAELVVLLRSSLKTRRLAGVSVAIYNPALDPDESAARTLVDCLAAGLGSQ
jgi:arginase